MKSGIIFTQKSPSKTDLVTLYKQAAFTKERKVQNVEKMLKSPGVQLTAWDGDKLVAYVRALTDGVYRAFVCDLVVAKGYRGKGLGTEMMNRIMKELKDVKKIYLHCRPSLEEFYKKFDFSRAKYPVMIKKHPSIAEDKSVIGETCAA